MAKLYASTDDIDLFSGLISEKPLRGAMVGPTLACLLGLQFRHLRQCDRWSNHKHLLQKCLISAGSGTRATLLKCASRQSSYVRLVNFLASFASIKVILKVRTQSLSSLLCRNTDNVEALPRRAMDIESGANPLTACDDLPKWDYQAWNELS